MTLVILLRVFLSVSANAIQKRLLLDGARVNETWILTYALMLGPAAIAAALHPAGGGMLFWRDILIGSGLDAIGNLAMVAALRGTDLSVFGPLNAFRPILALIAGWFLLDEKPTQAGFLGIGLTFVGALVLFSGGESKSSRRKVPDVWKMVSLRMAGLSLGTIGAVFLKRAASHSSAEMTVAAWIICGLVVLITVALVRQPEALRNLGEPLRQHRKWLGLHAFAFVVMQWLTIVIFQKTLLAYSFVFFQLAVVLQVIVGRFLFSEPAFLNRLLGALIMSAGSGLILWKG